MHAPAARHTPRRRSLPLLFVMLAFLLLPAAPAPAESGDRILLLATTDDVASAISQRVLEEAYAHLGLTPVFKCIPNKRSDQMASHGDLDGVVNRVDSIDAEALNLVRVDTPVNHFSARAQVNGPAPAVDGWESLKPLRVGIRLGTHYAEQATLGFPQLTVRPSYDALFDMLAAGHLDVVVASDIEAMRQRDRLQFNDLRAVGSPLETFRLYHYLHKRHTALAARLDKVLQAMHRSGRIRELRAETLDEFFGPR